MNIIMALCHSKVFVEITGITRAADSNIIGGSLCPVVNFTECEYMEKLYLHS